MIGTPRNERPSNGTLRALGIFLAGLAVTFGGGAAIGAAVGPDRPSSADDAHRQTAESPADSTDDPTSGMPGTDAADAAPAGLMVTRDGYTFVLAERELSAGSESELDFVIIGPDGMAVTDFDVAHEKQLHLVIVSRDLVGYAHLHPDLDESGNWTVTVPPLDTGSYRVFADFVPRGGSNLVLGADLAVPGDFAPAALPEPSASSTVDGYTVTVEGTLVAGGEAELTLSVELDGEPVTDLDSYLGALGHLVAIRDGDLAYLHVHPLDETAGPGGPTATFGVDVPTAGMYRLFFDFSHGGEVRTAAVTVAVDGTAGANEGSDVAGSEPESTEGHDGH